MCRKYERAVTKSCLFCKAEFTKKPSLNQVYCSRLCADEAKKAKRVEVICSTCGGKYNIPKCRNIFNKYYCSRDCADHKRSDNNLKIDRSKNFYKRLIKESICKCGVHEDYLLQIHHKDGNKRNQSLDNLEVVCANCHIKRHLTFKKDGELGYNTKILTSKEILEILNNETITSV